MGQCGSKRAASDTSLTPDDVENVQQTWKQVYADWESTHGVAFFLRLFGHYQQVKGFFQQFNGLSEAELSESPQLRAHVMVFGRGLSSMIDNLNDTETLVSIIHKVTDSHVARGIALQYFKDALKELLNFLTETLKPKTDVKNSWAKTVAIVDKIITDRVNSTKKA